MDNKLIKDRLWSIAKPYPRLQGLLMRKVGEGTQGGIWCKLIRDANLDIPCFEDACYEYESLRKPLPDPLDNLIHDLIADSRDLKAEQHRKWEQHSKYHAPKAGEVYDYVFKDGIGSIAVTLGQMVRRKELTAEQNKKMLDQMFDWEKGKIDKPEWLEKMHRADNHRQKP
jgi:hypothetical protein